jgi:PEP-CTERM motif
VNNICKKSVAVAAIVMAASTGAQAANTSLSMHDSAETGGKLLGNGSFEDTYSFSVLGPSVLDGSTVPSANINGGSYSLLNKGANNASGGNDDRSDRRFGRGDVIASSVSPSPVPEPETHAMLIAGLGLMGLIAVRRKHKAA